MKNQVGNRVLYQPASGQQQAAIITGWNDDTQVANLMVFSDGSAYTSAHSSVQEGTADGTLQQLGVLSRAAETRKLHKQQAEQIFRELSGLKLTPQRELNMKHRSPSKRPRSARNRARN